jgi:hypothetical protein
VSQSEKKRLAALQRDDQEAYMHMVEASKNERLKILLDKTSHLLVQLGAAVQRQKDSGQVSKESVFVSSASKSKEDSPGDQRIKHKLLEVNVDCAKMNCWLDGQRQYNATVHIIEEKVMLN